MQERSLAALSADTGRRPVELIWVAIATVAILAFIFEGRRRYHLSVRSSSRGGRGITCQRVVFAELEGGSSSSQVWSEVNQSTTSHPAMEPPKTARRDQLLAIQAEAQAVWDRQKLFEVDAPLGDVDGGECLPPRFYGNFPYPYMNGLLHLGHAFTVSKVEFATAYHRLCGKKALFPFAFHCTGMPIKACADKLAREIKEFGNPPVFRQEEDKQSENVTPETVNGHVPADAKKEKGEDRLDTAKFRTKKSKAAAKTGSAKYQWNIMETLGLKAEDIAKFQDPYHWLTFFPPLAKDDLRAFGTGADWRRSFITTNMNPYYDSFVRWHLSTLKAKGKVVKDKRYAIYSPKDGQPCADHDRASGEGVQPQEYTLIKMKVNPPFTGKLAALEGKNVYLAAATLRPETMYGQTNAWVLPDGDYGAFEINDDDVFVITKRAAMNLAFQGGSKVPGKPNCLLELKGKDLIGVALSSPLSVNPVIYALPMLTILTDKGTGIVTSVPSDAPDDYAALMDLKNKPALREKLGVEDKWVLPFEVVPIINIPEFGDMSAVKVCQDLKIKSQNDKDKLAEAKRLTYLKGFLEGTMLVGEHKGTKVQDAKPLLRKMLVANGQAVMYSEPEKQVISRSDDECVVALTDQWYLTYGESEWKALTEKCLAKMNLYHEETRNMFGHTMSWLNQWACSRSFGLGTQLPWDEEFLIESLSDSTIYMAYYAVAHILQGGDMYGKPDERPVKPEQLTHEVWDYIFLGGKVPQTDIDSELLKRMKREFEYWYPFDLRVSGKDLVQNHLTFCAYNHTAMFGEDKWPRAFRCNGHLMLNSEKMSKSTGNFLTLREAIQKYSADATRFALADAGDTMDDANFVGETANAAILRLTKEICWIQEVLDAENLRTGKIESFADKVFENEINIAVELTAENYNNLMFREVLKSGFFDFQSARDEYRSTCGAAGMHKDLIRRFIEVQTLLLAPICPHYAEHVWSKLLKKDGCAIVAGWPAASRPDYTLQKANAYLRDTIVDLRKTILKPPKKQGKKGGAPAPAPTFTEGHIFVAERYLEWQEHCLRVLAAHFDAASKAFAEDAKVIAGLMKTPLSQIGDVKAVMRQCMSFVRFKKEEAIKAGPQVLDLKLPFSEVNLLTENAEFIKRSLQLEKVELFVHSSSDDEAIARVRSDEAASRARTAKPGNPVGIFL
ncbi:hypothetical protein CBR_g949 [Chara braunii]|uniref:leucine--tRNA ligase n=1 Tax=Chara braunii TaxID=69332 RepID=A0A388KCN9_CHABU|nr:hypothetical protein CBR_g949 [Chara braunii]|eukprot:GBG67828.1 hypothetical protein CBR_g949 [Chara braunii]